MLSTNDSVVADLTALLLFQAFCMGEVNLSDVEIEKLDAQAPDMLPNIVLNLNDWTKSKQQQGFPFSSRAPTNATPSQLCREKSVETNHAHVGLAKNTRNVVDEIIVAVNVV